MSLQKVFSKQNRALLSELVRTDFKLRYQGSALGYLWSVLKPLMMFVILYVVFTKFLKIGGDIPHYPIYLLLGIVLWNFFGEMTGQSLGSIVGRGDLIRKIRIPRWIVVFSSSISALISLGINLVIVAVFLVVNQVDLLSTAIFLPLILAEIYLFSLGVSFFLAAAFVKYRDLSNIWEVVMQAGYFLTPILYPLSMIVNVDYQKLLLLNPMAQAIQDARYAVVSHHPDVITIHRVVDSVWVIAIPFIAVVAALIIGVLYFKKESKHFAENL